jgi:hypothetical protein
MRHVDFRHHWIGNDDTLTFHPRFSHAWPISPSPTLSPLTQKVGHRRSDSAMHHDIHAPTSASFIMAIYTDYPGLVADVVINGRALEEHRDDESPDSNTTSVYIEAKAGEHFAVRYTLPSTQFTTYSIKASVRLDGTHVRANVYDRNTYKSDTTQLFDASAAYVGGRDVGQRFRFTALTTCKRLPIILKL